MRRFVVPLSVVLAFACVSPALAQHGAAVDVVAPWARASAGTARTGAAYMTIRNKAASDDRLLAASSPVARRAELHTHIAEGNVMQMRKIDAVELKPNAAAELKPGGLHVMFFDLKAPLKEGARFPLTLKFEKAGEISVQVDVRSATATSPAPAPGGHHGH